ncbi:MAG: hypothetical protein SCARUB_02187 [Candidatus Scalindua rubra]|uniref:Uncharacterized protein n=1 Tax=Candidatus Scalindua rubra TaxID=1872076 RepID=A0A1E3XAN2_9BACT|nr:MAG: hypothetical protein SCARUB_02187 [Candidatus Scalindua rubra]
MWKRKNKQQTDVVVEETPSSKEEQEVSEVAEEAPSTEKQQVGEVAEEIPSSKEEQEVSEVSEEAPFTEEESPYGVFVFGKKVKGSFKKFITALFTIFILPPTILFGLLVVTSVVLLAFPLISVALPIVLIALCILLIALPVVVPFITVISLITGKGKVHFGLKNKKLAIKILGITFPPHAGR